MVYPGFAVTSFGETQYMIMDWQFIHEEIEVEFEKRPGPPVRFVWRGEQVEIAEVLRAWADHSFGPFRYPARWWQRRHRNYYRVRTAQGWLADFYLDRGPGKWVLYRIRRPGQAGGRPAGAGQL